MTDSLKAGAALLSKFRPPGLVGSNAWVPKSIASRYVFSILTVAISAVLRWWLAEVFGPMPPFLTFYPAVLLIAIVAGRGPGILAILLSVLSADYLFLMPRASFALWNSAEIVSLAIFAATTFGLCELAERLRRSRSMETTARRQLELATITMASITEGVIAADPQGRVVLLNEAAQKMLGCKLTEVGPALLSSIFRTIEAANRAPIGGLIETVLHSGSLGGFVQEPVLLLADGREIPIELSGGPIRFQDGSVAGVVLTFRDCTERKRAQAEVQRLLAVARAEKEWLSLVLGSITEEVYFTDTQKRYVYVNPAALREFGSERLEGVEVEKAIENLVVLRPDGSPRPACEAPPLRALTGEIVRDEEQIVRTPRTGELRHRQVSSAPVRDASGQIIGAVSVVRDITEQKRVEASLREADHRKNVFLATLSHELRNPLAPIRTAARLLESAQVSPDDLERCRAIISRQVTHMASLLDDLRDVSRFTRGELTLRKAYASLHQLVDAAVETVQPLINTRHHRLHLDLPPDQLTLEVDRVRLTQVMTNLLTNAAKYTDPGGDITLGCRLERDGLVIFVRDTGIGLSASMFSQVFEMFVQLDSSKERAEGGLGIGLALVKGLVELHGGRIEVHSAGRDQGTTFTVKLPRSVVVERAEAASQGSAAETVTGNSRRVLIADDNVDAVETLSMLLRMYGHEVHVAHDGARALELATRIRPDIALLDIGMPGLSGYEVAERIRREAWGERVTLIALTGWGQQEDKRKAEAAGFDRHFTKPMDSQLLEAIFGDAT